MKDIDDLLSDIDDGEYRGLGDLADADEAPPDNDSTAADEKDGDEFDVAEDDSPALDSPDNQASAISGGEENRENPIQPGLYNTMTFSVRGTFRAMRAAYSCTSGSRGSAFSCPTLYTNHFMRLRFYSRPRLDRGGSSRGWRAA